MPEVCVSGVSSGSVVDFACIAHAIHLHIASLGFLVTLFSSAAGSRTRTLFPTVGASSGSFTPEAFAR